MRFKASIAIATLFIGAPLPVAVQAQTAGESRCGADGYVERYNAYLHSWQSSLLHCR